MNPCHVLVVDDDLITSSALKMYLEAHQYKVTLAEDCKHARQMLQGPVKFDLMILDYLMPDGNGTELLQSIAERNDLQRPPVIMSSSIINSNNPSWDLLFHRLAPQAQSLVQAFVSKPYSFKEVDVILRKTLKVHVTKTTPPQVLSGDYVPPPARQKFE